MKFTKYSNLIQPENDFAVSFFIKKAFDIAKKCSQNLKLSSKDWYMSCVIDKSWLKQKSLSLKPAWFELIRLFLPGVLSKKKC